MFESIIMAGNASKKEPLFDFDPSRQALGDKNLINYGTSSEILDRKYHADGESLEHGVVDVPGYGRAFYFNSKVWFGKNKDLTGNLYAGDFEIVVDFMTERRGVTETLFATGGYADTVEISSGIQIYLDTTPQTYAKLFVTRTGTTGWHFLQATQPADLKDIITFKKSGTSVTASNNYASNTTGLVSNIPDKDTVFAVGTGAETVKLGYNKYPQYNFKGWLRRLTITKL